MKKNISWKTIASILVAGCLFIFGGNVFAQSEGEPEVEMSDDVKLNMSEVLIEFYSGEIESYLDGILRVNGNDFTLTGSEQCQDMEENTVDIDSLKEGDSVTVNYVVPDMTVTSVRLDQRGVGGETDDSLEDHETPEKKSSQKSIQFKDGVYTN